MTRPSMRWNVINSSVTETSLTRASVLTAMLMPSLLNPAQIGVNSCPNLVKLTSREPVILGQDQWLHPELADHSLPSDVNMRRFVAVEAVKVEPMRPWNVLNSRHSRRCFDAYLLRYNKSARWSRDLQIREEA